MVRTTPYWQGSWAGTWLPSRKSGSSVQHVEGTTNQFPPLYSFSHSLCMFVCLFVCDTGYCCNLLGLTLTSCPASSGMYTLSVCFQGFHHWLCATMNLSNAIYHTCLITHVIPHTLYHTCHTTHVIIHTSYHTHHTTHVIPQTSYHTSHTTHFIPHILYRTPHTLHVLPHTSYHKRHTTYFIQCYKPLFMLRNVYISRYLEHCDLLGWQKRSLWKFMSLQNTFNFILVYTHIITNWRNNFLMLKTEQRKHSNEGHTFPKG